MSDGWIEWSGGDGTKTQCPVSADQLVRVKFRDGFPDDGYGAVPAAFYLNSEHPVLPSWWDNRNHPQDIIAYRVADA